MVWASFNWMTSSPPSRRGGATWLMRHGSSNACCSRAQARPTPRHWHDTTLAEELDLADTTEDQLYDAMDWLLKRQSAIEKKLAKRHLTDGALVLYDVTSSYYEGKTCPLAQASAPLTATGRRPASRSSSTARDRSPTARPIAVQVYPGNTRWRPQDRSRSSRGGSRSGSRWSRVVLVGDRGMLHANTWRLIACKKHPGLGWILGQLAERVLIRRLLGQRPPGENPSEDLNAWQRSRRRNSPVNGWWPATIPSWPSSARKRQRRSSHRHSKPNWRPLATERGTAEEDQPETVARDRREGEARSSTITRSAKHFALDDP